MRRMMMGIREEWMQTVKGRDGGERGESGEIRMVILAGLKDELLKFGLITPNLCFVLVFPVMSVCWFVCLFEHI